MTTTARLALLDCEAALEDLRSEPRGLQWRTRWAAAVALLRAVGHILKNVDHQSSRAMAVAIDAEFAALKATKPEPAIFWQFIDQERNNILKSYKPSAKQNVTIQVPTIVVNRHTREAWMEGETEVAYDHVMSDGPFQGRDPREIVAQAVVWWREYLDRVDQRALGNEGSV